MVAEKLPTAKKQSRFQAADTQLINHGNSCALRNASIQHL
jgi:hypothetical protein